MGLFALDDRGITGLAETNVPSSLYDQKLPIPQGTFERPAKFELTRWRRLRRRLCMHARSGKDKRQTEARHANAT
ncbi:hypothetical protein [Altererythrobacter sp. MTPC7]|uniref:hypothetical protein n=1 Tax=Altererythrobacter sp. MTPC7 TaxID=3056567 RepID=UPI0036F28778